MNVSISIITACGNWSGLAEVFFDKFSRRELQGGKAISFPSLACSMCHVPCTMYRPSRISVNVRDKNYVPSYPLRKLGKHGT